MNEFLGEHYLEDSLSSLRAYKKLAEKALDQLSEDEFFITLDEEANSIAVIMKHMAKHFRSSEWKSLSIPRNKSLDFNKYLREQKPASDTEHRFDAVSKFVEESEKPTS